MFNALEMAPTNLEYPRRWRPDPGVTVTRLGDGDDLLVGHGNHVWASGDVGKCGDNSLPSRDEVVAFVYTMLESMLCTKASIHDAGPRKYNPEFPVSLPLFTEIALECTNENRQYSSSQIGQANAVFSVDIMTGNSILL
jgi:hypothetical protein